MKDVLLRLTRVILSLGVLAALGTVGHFALKAQGFSIETVLWEGPKDGLVDQAEVLSLLQIVPGKTPLSEVNPTEASQKLLSHPWVNRAAIHLEYPNQIQIQIEPRRAVAIWFESENNAYFLDDLGEPFASLHDPRESDLPGVWAPKEQLHKVAAQLSRLLVKYPRVWRGVESVVVDSGGVLKIYFAQKPSLGVRMAKLDWKESTDFSDFWARFERVTQYLREHNIDAQHLEWNGSEKIVVKTRSDS